MWCKIRLLKKKKKKKHKEEEWKNDIKKYRRFEENGLEMREKKYKNSLFLRSKQPSSSSIFFVGLGE